MALARLAKENTDSIDTRPYNQYGYLLATEIHNYSIAGVVDQLRLSVDVPRHRSPWANPETWRGSLIDQLYLT